jgi:transposase-like protein
MIKLLFTIFLNEYLCAMLLRKVRWYNGVYCPLCYSKRVKRYGKYRGIFQRYYCKDCKHTFNDKTNTIFHYSHAQLSDWFIAIYLFYIPTFGCSISSISIQLSIPYKQCYHMIRRVMDSSSIACNSKCKEDKLNGIVEIDELYIHAGMKGKSYHHNITVVENRKPRRRGIKPWRGRGTFAKDHPMVICYHQQKREGEGEGEGEDNNTTILDVPVQYDSIASLVCNRVDHNSIVYTDEYRAYHSLKDYGYKHYTVTHSSKEYARDGIHINNCECIANLFKIWLSKFMGVNKYNLNTYAKTYQFIYNNRRLDIFSKFIKILSSVLLVLIIATTFYSMSENNK